ncbi:MAG TPA: Mpo1-like protein [Steroidobacteraceae bacterium]|nr:Mpo1-like protein [Steroidobacteraceae bacterium]
MASLPDVLASYGRYHRDPRNRLTHYFGVPAIVYSMLIALALYSLSVAGVRIGLDRFVVAVAALGYLCADVRLGLALAVVLTGLAAAAEATVVLGRAQALAVAGVVFVLGWALQLLGHRIEGNRPALLDNLIQIFVAPLYLVAELGFALGLRPGLRTGIEQRLR